MPTTHDQKSGWKYFVERNKPGGERGEKDWRSMYGRSDLRLNGGVVTQREIGKRKGEGKEIKREGKPETTRGEHIQ